MIYSGVFHQLGIMYQEGKLTDDQRRILKSAVVQDDSDLLQNCAQILINGLPVEQLEEQLKYYSEIRLG